MKCDKCKREMSTQEHHLLPKYMDNKSGLAWKNYVSRVELCFDCHLGSAGIHQKVLYPILLKFSGKKIPYDIFAEDKMWKSLFPTQKEIVKDLAVKESWEWLHG